MRDNFFNKVSLYQSAIDTAKDQEALFQQSLGGIVAHLVSLARFLNRAKILIADQFRTITPESLAQQLNMGYSNFRRIFKEYTGFSPAKYIQEVRMNKVKEASTHTANPIKQIAYEMGFKNEDYFFTARELTQGKSL